MDYAFVPATPKPDFAIEAARTFFSSGPAAPVAVPRGSGSVKAALDWIDLRLPTGDTVGTTYLVSHASPEHISIPMMPGGAQTTYKRLVDLLGGIPRFIAPSSFRTTPGPTVFIKGCRIGARPPFLLLLKQHLGGTVTVKAPRHFNAFAVIRNRTQTVALDYLCYQLELHRRDRIASHTDLVAAFRAGGFLRYDGSPFPAGVFEKLLGQLPKAPKLAAGYLPGEKSKKEIKRKLATRIEFNEPIGGRNSARGLAEFRSKRVVEIVNSVNQQQFDAKALPDHVQDAETAWDNGYRDATSIPFTFGEHLGLKAGEDPIFINWTSLPAYDSKTKQKGRSIAGVYYRYQLLLPVTSVTDGKLLFSSSVARGPALATPSTWPTDPTHLATLFRTV